MLNFNLGWNRPARPPTGLMEHTLCLTLSAPPHAVKLAGNFCLVLDCSKSMDTESGSGTKLNNAKQACRIVRDCLTDDDQLALITYNARPVVRFSPRRRADLSTAALEDVLRKIRAESVTCTDRALAEAEKVLRPIVRPDRVTTILLLTDGHPTTPDGPNLGESSYSSFYATARDLAASGINLVTVGLGDARHYNSPFLTRLADEGRGSFCYAPVAQELGPLLEKQIRAAQATNAADVEIQIEPRMDAVQILSFCRVAPEYRPIAIPDRGPWNIACGNLQASAVFLARVQTPGMFGMTTGEYPVFQFRASWLKPDGSRSSTRERVASMRYTDVLSEQQAIDPEIDQLRLRWEMNQHQAQLAQLRNVNKTGQLLTQIFDEARGLGLEEVAIQVNQQLDELRRSGRLDPHMTATVSQQIRSFGDATAERTEAAMPRPGGFGVVGPPPGESTLEAPVSQPSQAAGFGFGLGGGSPATPAPVADFAQPLRIDLAQLEVVNGRAPGLRYRLNRLRMLVGRVDGSEHRPDIDLGTQQTSDAVTISRKHAEFTWEAGRLYLRDLGSATGTSVEGRQLAAFRDGTEGETFEVLAGQLLQFGDVRLRVVME